MFHSLRRGIRTAVVLGLLLVASIPASVSANPFGQGVFGADVPFGVETNITIALGGNVGLNLLPNGNTFEGTGSHTLTVTTTDVVGYRLYIYAPNGAAMTNGSETIAASSNVAPGTLAMDTWGYNTDGSTTDFIGVTDTPVVLKDANGPYKNGDDTTVTYGMRLSATKGAGEYASSVVYTAVTKSQ